MPLVTQNPEIIDGVEYPYLGLSMAMQPDWRESSMGAQCAVAFHPYRVTEDGKIERAMRDGYPVQRSISFGDAFTEDADSRAAAEGILAAVQGYLTAKGL